MSTTAMKMSTAVMNKSQAAIEAAVTPNMCDAVQCTLRFEKCKGGFRIHCCCDDQTECPEFQTLCQALCDGNMLCCCMHNGNPIGSINLCCGECECDCASDGCCVTCTGCDKNRCKILRACCDFLEICCKNGGCCNICFSDTCCCSGTCAA